MPGAALLGAALLVPIWLGGRLAAHLFPAAMPGAVRVFQLLATAQIALLIANPVQFLLYGAGRPEWCTASDALITLLFGAMAIWLAPAYGAIGVAWALLIAQTGVKAVLGHGAGDRGLGDWSRDEARLHRRRWLWFSRGGALRQRIAGRGQRLPVLRHCCYCPLACTAGECAGRTIG